MIEPTGYTALDLIGFTDKGGYDPTANYVKNDIVTVGNTKWRCKVDDTTGVTPAENANWTIYLESATSLAGMSDVTLTSPKNGDGLVHDGNDWKNIPIMTKEQWKKNGAYNILPNMWTTQVKNGLTYTLRSDGTIAVDNGSPSATTYINIVPQSSPIKFPVGKYKMIGFADTGVTGYKNFYVVNITTNTVYQYFSNNGIFEVTDASHEWYCSYAFDTGADPTVFSNAILYPMITTDLNATYADYVPYAKTNRELTEDSYGVVTLDGTKETLAESPVSFVSVPSGTETVVVNYAATSNMTGCFIVTCTIVDGNATGYRRIRMRLARTGQQFYFNVYTAPGMVMSSNYQSTSIALPMRLKAGDNVTILATQDSGNSLRFAGTIEFIGKK